MDSTTSHVAPAPIFVAARRLDRYQKSRLSWQYWGWFAIVLLLCDSSQAARADSNRQRQLQSLPAVSSVSSEAGKTLPRQEPSVSLETANLLALGELNEKDTDFSFPGPIESITQDVGGFRTSLASVGIGFQGIDLDLGEYNLLDNAHPRSPQQYDGQGPTYSVGIHEWVFTFDTSHIGLPGGQLLFSPLFYTTSRSVDGPTKLEIGALNYYQSLFNGHVGVKFGYGQLYNYFIGLAGVGGNATIQTNGVSALIPVELGLPLVPSSGPFATVNVHTNGGFYDKVGVGRGLSPLGEIPEVRASGVGLRFGAPQAKTVVIEEFGVNHPFSATGHQLWVRAGGIYNFTDYSTFDGRTAENWGGYALADYQVRKFDSANPASGIFVGASALYATPQVNPFTAYFEGRIYAIGLFDARPHDVDSVVIGRNVFSQSIRRRLAAVGTATAPSQFSVAYAHTFRVIPGLLVGPSLAYSDHPAFLGRFKGALTAGLSLVVLY